MIDDENSDIVYDKMREEFEKLTLRTGEESVRDYVARTKAQAMKLLTKKKKIVVY